MAAHTCLFPGSNKRFANPPIPRPNSLISITGTFYSEAVPDNAGVKRLPLEINEIAFIGSDTAPTTPVKGMVALSFVA